MSLIDDSRVVLAGLHIVPVELANPLADCLDELKT